MLQEKKGLGGCGQHHTPQDGWKNGEVDACKGEFHLEKHECLKVYNKLQNYLFPPTPCFLKIIQFFFLLEWANTQ